MTQRGEGAYHDVPASDSSGGEKAAADKATPAPKESRTLPLSSLATQDSPQIQTQTWGKDDVSEQVFASVLRFDTSKPSSTRNTDARVNFLANPLAGVRRRTRDEGDRRRASIDSSHCSTDVFSSMSNFSRGGRNTGAIRADKSSLAIMKELRAIETRAELSNQGRVPPRVPGYGKSPPLVSMGGDDRRGSMRLTKTESMVSNPVILSAPVITATPAIYTTREEKETASMLHSMRSNGSVAESSQGFATQSTGSHNVQRASHIIAHVGENRSSSSQLVYSGSCDQLEASDRMCRDSIADLEEEIDASTFGGDTEDTPTMQCIAALLSSQAWSAVVLTCTFHLLFNADLYYLILPMEADWPMFYVTCTVVAVLVVELILHIVYYRTSYICSVFFMVDIIAICSVIPEMLQAAEVLDPSQPAGPNLAIARSSRAARIGMQLGRLGKLTQRLRYTLQSWPCCKSEEVRVSDDFELDDEEFDVADDSTLQLLVTHKLSTKSVSMILLLVLGVVLLDNQAPPTHTESLISVYLLEPSLSLLDAIVASVGDDLVCFRHRNETLYGDCDVSSTHRRRDVVTYRAGDEENCGEIRLSVCSMNKMNDIFSVSLTLFVMAAMLIYNFVLQRDIRTLCVRPIERLTHVIESMVRDPMVKFQSSKTSADPPTETDLMIESVKTLGSLIQVGFGAAGADVVSQNLQKGRLFTMLPGANVQAIFCFCDIRNFTEATERLRHNVMFFVNGVAAIVHDTALLCGGHPNKNIGDAFLLAWKFCKIRADRLSVQGFGAGTRDSTRAQTMADSALAFTLLTQDRIRTSDALHMLNQKISSGYTCEMGFGLHFGWAIEGAIGSAQKVDVSYLSPHVNIAARLEGLTKQYKAAVLMSDDFRSMLSDGVARRYAQVVDRVTVKGSSVPHVLYAAECTPPEMVLVPPSLIPSSLRETLSDLRRFASFDTPPNLSSATLSDRLDTKDDVHELSQNTQNTSSSQDILESHFPSHDVPYDSMVESGTFDLKTVAAMAFSHYCGGQWSEARALWRIVVDAFDDTKSLKMLEYVEKHIDPDTGTAPKTWKGYRALTEK